MGQTKRKKKVNKRAKKTGKTKLRIEMTKAGTRRKRKHRPRRDNDILIAEAEGRLAFLRGKAAIEKVKDTNPELAAALGALTWINQFSSQSIIKERARKTIKELTV